MTWFKLFYTNMSSCIQNNGWPLLSFSFESRSETGMPALPYLFIVCTEVLANAVRKDENIRGINIADVECKLSQYAFDTTMILDGSELSFSTALLLLDNFAISSGLKINYEKTEALWIGSYKDRDFSIPSNKPITWARSKVYALGVLFSTSEINQSNYISFREKTEKNHEQLVSYIADSSWQNCNTEIAYSISNGLLPIIFTITSRFYQGD